MSSPDTRIEDLARALLRHVITPEDIPEYDRPSVQAVLVTWWLERAMQRRVTRETPIFRTL